MNEINGIEFPNINTSRIWGFKSKLISIIAGKGLVILNADLTLAKSITVKDDRAIMVKNSNIEHSPVTHFFDENEPFINVQNCGIKKDSMEKEE